MLNYSSALHFIPQTRTNLHHESSVNMLNDKFGAHNDLQNI